MESTHTTGGWVGPRASVHAWRRGDSVLQQKLNPDSAVTQLSAYHLRYVRTNIKYVTV